MSASPDQGAKLRVLMTADAVGGVWQYALDLAGGLRAHGVETTLAVLGPVPSADQQRRAEASGVKLVQTGLPLDWTAETPEAVLHAGRVIAETTFDGRTLAYASSMEGTLRTADGDKSDKAKQVGGLVAERAKAAGVEQVVFDRAGHKYHGRIAALADGAREAGLGF